MVLHANILRRQTIPVICIFMLSCAYPNAYVPESCDTPPAASGLDIVLSPDALRVEDTTRARCFIIHKDGTRSEADTGVEWTTDNPRILEVFSTGEVRALSAGTAEILARAAGYSTTRRINVEGRLDYSGILISEVYYDPDADEESLEFIEIVNTATDMRDIGGVSIIDGSSKSTPFTFSSGTRMEPGTCMVVARSSDKFYEKFCINPDCNTLKLTLNNSGEAVFITAPDGTRIDQVYIKGGTAEFPAPDNWCSAKQPSAPEGQSIYRNSLSDTGSCTDWSAGIPSPGNSTAGYSDTCTQGSSTM